MLLLALHDSQHVHRDARVELPAAIDRREDVPLQELPDGFHELGGGGQILHGVPRFSSLRR
jgi:hypothetical protein